MNDSIAKLSFNFIGKILGSDTIVVQGDKIVSLKKDTILENDSASDFRSFATFERKFLGGILTYKIGSKTKKHKFIRCADSDSFVESLNTLIAKHITTTIEQKVTEFYSLAFDEYPRDSWVSNLAQICMSLSRDYEAQSEQWERYLNPELIEKVKNLISYHPLNIEYIREQHEEYQLIKRKEFFDVVESNPLTNEQRLGVLRSNDRNMVLAAAGTGKTSVMVAKTLDLIDRGLAKPSEILVLAYNKTAAGELSERLEDKAKKSNIELESTPDIATFHALGRMILRNSNVDTNISIFTEDDVKLKLWVTSWLEEYLSSDVDRIYDFINMFPEPVNPFDFKSKSEYEAYIRDNEFRTLNSDLVKGYQELLIANFLYENGVEYKYESPYVTKRRIDIGFDYRPDFKIIEPELYIEHFGIDRNGRTRPDIDRVSYNQSINNKRMLHNECETVLIETFHYEWIEGVLLENLKKKLLDNGVVLNPLSSDELFNKLRDMGHITGWGELLTKALQSIRVERLTKESIQSRFDTTGVHHSKKLSEILDLLHHAYISELREQNAIDFDDMIIRAIQEVNAGKYIPEWRYILVDEFQDISTARMEFIQTIIKNGPQPSLTVVGDDWQSIYRFNGGKLELTTRFGEIVGSYTLTKLQKTFRYNNSIADTAGQFIMENPEQYKKYIETHTVVEDSQIYLLDDKSPEKGGLNKRVAEVVQKIRENDATGSIAVIARYNYLLNEAKSALKQMNSLRNVNFWSFHKSKGLEADYGILIGFFQGKMGFPNENKDNLIVESLLPSLDPYPHSEERRLLYVGITRARKKVYIIANPTAPSDFVTELLSPKYKINVVSKAFSEESKKRFKCPYCTDGYLRLVKGPYSDFYACSTGFGCPVGKARVCEKCHSPSIDTRNESVCNNSLCGCKIKICPECGRPMKIRNGQYGDFWGCTGYGIKDDQCKVIIKVKPGL